jgi:bifunctional DNase/RNase
MNKIQLKILGISAGNVASSYTLLLEEVNGERKLPVVIGVLEAQAIAIEIEKIEPLRPMTHDLFKSLANSFGLKLKEVLIHKLHEGIFYANLIVTNGENEKSIDSRTSDAIALALRFNTPIFIYEEIMDEAGIELKSMHIKDLKEDPEQQEGFEFEDITEKPKDSPKSEKSEDIESLGIRELNKKLKEAIAVEDYFLAAKIRDVINKKKGGK